jgi:hypothetical protein
LVSYRTGIGTHYGSVLGRKTASEGEENARDLGRAPSIRKVTRRFSDSFGGNMEKPRCLAEVEPRVDPVIGRLVHGKYGDTNAAK